MEKWKREMIFLGSTAACLALYHFALHKEVKAKSITSVSCERPQGQYGFEPC